MPLSPDPEKRKNQVANLTPGGSPGRPVGSRSWSTVTKELLEDEELFQNLVDNMERKPAWLASTGTKTLMQAITTAQAIKAMGGSHFSAEWLRKTGWGDHIDLTSNGETIKIEPIIVSTIKARQTIIEGEIVEPTEETSQEEEADGSTTSA